MDSRVLQLAKLILQNATEYNQHFALAGGQSRTLDIESFPELSLSEEAQAARDNALEACSELQAILKGPTEIVRSAIGQHSEIVYLQALYRFKVAQPVPSDGGAISYKNLASKCRLEESILRRIVRYAITNNIFKEPQSDYVCHNGASKALAQYQN